MEGGREEGERRERGGREEGERANRRLVVLGSVGGGGGWVAATGPGVVSIRPYTYTWREGEEGERRERGGREEGERANRRLVVLGSVGGGGGWVAATGPGVVSIRPYTYTWRGGREEEERADFCF